MNNTIVIGIVAIIAMISIVNAATSDAESNAIGEFLGKGIATSSSTANAEDGSTAISEANSVSDATAVVGIAEAISDADSSATAHDRSIAISVANSVSDATTVEGIAGAISGAYSNAEADHFGIATAIIPLAFNKIVTCNSDARYGEINYQVCY